jgi:2,3-bisphosphoglycerate-dependent phosphoglycerate mutase
VAIEIVFETHSLTEDNEAGVATGWRDGRLSASGRALAAELGERRRHDGIQAVFASDLGRARDTVEIAFGSSSSVPVFWDWRLRECDYGSRNGAPAGQVHGDRLAYLESPYPGGESWQQAIGRIRRFLDDLRIGWNEDGARVLVVGHVATRWGFDHWIDGVPLVDLVTADFAWQEGWTYRLP